MKAALRRTFHGIAWGASGALAGWAGLASLGHADALGWLAEIPANFPILVVAATIPLLLLALQEKKRIPIIVAASAMAVICGLEFTSTPPRLDQAVGQAPTLSLMTWNTLFGKLDAKEAAAAIITADPDIVAFTEYTDGFGGRLEPLLRERYPYFSARSRDDFSGLGVFSKLPLTGWQATRGPFPRVKFSVILPDQTRVAIILIHPPVPIADGFRDRKAAFENLALEDFSQTPTIVLGDLNATWASQDLRKLCASMGLAIASRGYPTWHANWPSPLRIPLDHILASQNAFTSVAVEVGGKTASDHLSIMATVQLESSGRSPKSEREKSGD